MQQRRYRTRQREVVSAYLADNASRYLSVDDVWTGLSSDGESVGRSTVYRCLESMAQEGLALKATAPTGEARYRIASDGSTGQLVCLECGNALAIDCRMAAEFADHVQVHHAFRIDPARTVLYGMCGSCLDEAR